MQELLAARLAALPPRGNVVEHAQPVRDAEAAEDRDGQRHDERPLLDEPNVRREALRGDDVDIQVERRQQLKQPFELRRPRNLRIGKHSEHLCVVDPYRHERDVDVHAVQPVSGARRERDHEHEPDNHGSRRIRAAHARSTIVVEPLRAAAAAVQRRLGRVRLRAAVIADARFVETAHEADVTRRDLHSRWTRTRHTPVEVEEPSFGGGVRVHAGDVDLRVPHPQHTALCEGGVGSEGGGAQVSAIVLQVPRAHGPHWARQARLANVPVLVCVADDEQRVRVGGWDRCALPGDLERDILVADDSRRGQLALDLLRPCDGRAHPRGVSALRPGHVHDNHAFCWRPAGLGPERSEIDAGDADGCGSARKH